MKNVWKYSIIAALGGFLFGFETAVISGAEQIIQRLWQLDSFWHGLTVSISLIGTIVGAIIAGRLSEKYGRKSVLSFIALLYLGSAIGCGVSPVWSIFLFFRFLGGLAVGISSVVGPVYISEIAPAKDRGKLTGLFQIMIVSGIFIAYLTNFIFKGLGEDAWRYMLGIMAIPSIIFYFLLKVIPESPRWLLLHRSKEEANEVFQALGQDAYVGIQSTSKENKYAHVNLFQRSYSKPIIFAVLLAFFNQMTGINAILYYAPRIFEMAGFDQQLAYLQPIFIGGTNVLFTLLGMSIIDRFGRKKLLLVGAVGMVVFLLLTAYGLKAGNSTYLLAYIIGFIGAFALSQGAVIWVFIAEIFPNEVRAQGSSLGSTTHWVFAAIVSWIFPIIVEKYQEGGFYIFIFYALMVLLSFVFIGLMPETKGRSLEDMDSTVGH